MSDDAILPIIIRSRSPTLPLQYSRPTRAGLYRMDQRIVLVFGGAGTIGSGAVNALLKRGKHGAPPSSRFVSCAALTICGLRRSSGGRFGIGGQTEDSERESGQSRR